jgi:hypothetical protein
MAPRGPKFFEADDGLMFVLYLDASTRQGPRPATKQDTLDHPQAWAAFTAELQASERGEEPADPFRRIIEAVDPEDGAPLPEPRPHAQRRAAARAAGEVA